MSCDDNSFHAEQLLESTKLYLYALMASHSSHMIVVVVHLCCNYVIGLHKEIFYKNCLYTCNLLLTLASYMKYFANYVLF